MPTGRTGPNRCRSKPAIRRSTKPVSRPRPGHADLAGAIKYDFPDARYILERASARETTARVAVGAIAKQFLAHFGIEVLSHVIAVGPKPAGTHRRLGRDCGAQPEDRSAARLRRSGRRTGNESGRR